MEINGKKPAPNNQPSSLSDTPASPDRLPAEWISKLFAIMQARYGHKWMSAYPPGNSLDLALEEWARGLSGYNADEIKHGLGSWDGEWPPTLGEFRKACRPPPTKAMHRDFPFLPKPGVNKAAARLAIDEIRKGQGYRDQSSKIKTTKVPHKGGQE